MARDTVILEAGVARPLLELRGNWRVDWLFGWHRGRLEMLLRLYFRFDGRIRL